MAMVFVHNTFGDSNIEEVFRSVRQFKDYYEPNYNDPGTRQFMRDYRAGKVMLWSLMEPGSWLR